MNERPHLQNNRSKTGCRCGSREAHLPRKHKGLSSNPPHHQKKKEEEENPLEVK
jgi:hypothetical protein